MSGLGQGAFNGNEGGLKGAMAAAMKVMGARQQQSLPKKLRSKSTSVR